MVAEGLPTCVLADDHPAIRTGLRLRLEGDGVVRVVGEADDGVQALELIRSERPTIALVDLRMPRVDGMQVLAAARSEHLATRIVLVTALAERHLVEKAIAAGADGYVSKDSPLDVVVQAVETVTQGRTFIDPQLTHMLLSPDTERLSAREMQVLTLLGQGMQNKVIAAELGISEETVKTYVTNIMRKLGASSRTEAVVSAIRSSLIE